MNKNKLLLILKNGLLASFAKQAGEGKTRQRMGMAAAMIVGGAAIVLVVVMFSYGIAEVLASVGLLYVLPAIMMAAASVMALITTVYKTNGLLFGFKDYDLLMSLPIKTGTIITSRIIMLYGMNIFYSAAIMVPSTIVYAMFASPPLAFTPVFIILMLLTPLVPVIIATVIGSLIAIAASRFKRKSGASMIFTVAAMLVWMLFAFNMQNITVNFADIGAGLVDIVNKIYPLAAWYTSALTELNVPALLGFIGVSLGAFAAFVAIVGKYFTRMNSAITANRTVSDYKLGELKQSSPKRALLKKEFKRFTSSSAYMMNSGVGLILLTAAAVILLIVGLPKALALVGFTGFMDSINVMLPLGICFFVVMTCPSASSLSLEGKNLWIIRSLPVGTKDILQAKINMNFLLIFFAVLINSTIFDIVLKPGVAIGIMMFLTPLAYGFFTACFGLSLNISHPNFDWDSEIRVIKQSFPVMVMVFVGMAITIVPAILAAVAGPLVLYLSTIAVAIWGILIYRSIITQGVERFNSIE